MSAAGAAVLEILEDIVILDQFKDISPRILHIEMPRAVRTHGQTCQDCGSLKYAKMGIRSLDVLCLDLAYGNSIVAKSGRCRRRGNVIVKRLPDLKSAATLHIESQHRPSRTRFVARIWQHPFCNPLVIGYKYITTEGLYIPVVGLNYIKYAHTDLLHSADNSSLFHNILH